MGWNHRILAHESPNFDEVYLEIHEVFYNDETDEPEGYTSEGVTIGGERVEDLKWTLEKMNECLKKPILWAGEKWPNEYNDR